MEGENGVVLIVFAGEQDLDALALLLRPDLALGALHLGNEGFVVLLDGQLGQGDGILQLGGQVFVFGDPVLGALDLPEHLSGILLIVPKGGVGGGGLQLLHPVPERVDAERAAQLLYVGPEILKSVFGFFQCEYHLYPPVVC